MRAPTIATVLDKAADNWLWDGVAHHGDRMYGGLEMFSCEAVSFISLFLLPMTLGAVGAIFGSLVANTLILRRRKRLEQEGRVSAMAALRALVIASDMRDEASRKSDFAAYEEAMGMYLQARAIAQELIEKERQ